MYLPCRSQIHWLLSFVLLAMAQEAIAKEDDSFAIRNSNKTDALPILLSPYPVNTKDYLVEPGVISPIMQSSSDSLLNGKAKRSLDGLRVRVPGWDFRQEFAKVLPCGRDSAWCLSADELDVAEAADKDTSVLSLATRWMRANSYPRAGILSLWVVIEGFTVELHSVLTVVSADTTAPDDPSLVVESSWRMAYDLSMIASSHEGSPQRSANEDSMRLESDLMRAMTELNAMIECQLGYQWSSQDLFPAQTSADQLPELRDLKELGLKVPFVKRLLPVRAVTTDRIWMVRLLPKTAKESAKELASLPLAPFRPSASSR